MMIDLTEGKRTFVVPTSVRRDGVDYMGPEVKVTARSSDHAKVKVQEAGFTVNRHFEPFELKGKR